MTAFDFSFLVDIFANFYDFFMRIATLLALPLGELYDGVSWSFVNVFTDTVTTTTIGSSAAGDFLLNYLVAMTSLDTALWVAILVCSSSIWLITFFVKTIFNILSPLG